MTKVLITVHVVIFWMLWVSSHTSSKTSLHHYTWKLMKALHWKANFSLRSFMVFEYNLMKSNTSVESKLYLNTSLWYSNTSVNLSKNWNVVVCYLNTGLWYPNITWINMFFHETKSLLLLTMFHGAISKSYIYS